MTKRLTVVAAEVEQVVPEELVHSGRCVPDESDVLRLFDAAPDRYHALLRLDAGAGLRISEALGFEDGSTVPRPGAGGSARSPAIAIRTPRAVPRARSTSIRW